jgi:hypothetical protein
MVSKIRKSKNPFHLAPTNVEPTIFGTVVVVPKAEIFVRARYLSALTNISADLSERVKVLESLVSKKQPFRIWPRYLQASIC